MTLYLRSWLVNQYDLLNLLLKEFIYSFILLYFFCYFYSPFFKKVEQLDKLQIKFIKWTLILDWSTPTYFLMEETNEDKHWIGTSERAMSFEEKNKEREDR